MRSTIWPSLLNLVSGFFRAAGHCHSSDHVRDESDADPKASWNTDVPWWGQSMLLRKACGCPATNRYGFSQR